MQTDVALPSLKKLVASDGVVKERLFVIFNPSPLPVDVLEDVFWYVCVCVCVCVFIIDLHTASDSVVVYYV